MHAIAVSAIVADPFALATRTVSTQKDLAFQASSPKNFHGLAFIGRPFFCVFNP
jgi:hypothetical protein